MFIKELRLHDYRNINRAAIQFSDRINIIYGDNAQGKTNIVEAMFFSSCGRSQRTRIDRELIRFGERFANIKTTYCKGNYTDNIEVFLKRDEKKGIAINRMPIKRIGELFGELQTVIFSPEDLSVVTGSPAERRRFMDIQICQINKRYYYHLHTYYQVLKQRNTLLKRKKKAVSSELKDEIGIWDAQLIEHGQEIISIRNWFIGSVCPIAKDIHGKLTAGEEQLFTEYRPSVFVNDYETKLARNLEKDVLYGSTSIGPHKDDIVFFVNGQDAKTYGSQGQKRTVVLSLKLAEVNVVENEIGDTPVLLLDDALSELDSKRQEMLLDYIGNIQTIITATGMEDLVSRIKDNAKLFHIKNGSIDTCNK